MEMMKPTSKEIRTWDRAADSFDSLTRRIALIRQQINYAAMLGDVARAHGAAVKVADPAFMAAASTALEDLDNLRYRLGLAMDAAESGELAIQPTTDGSDLQVVAPESLASKWEPYTVNAGDVPTGQLGIAPLIVLGIVVVVVIGGIATVTALSDSYANKVSKDLAIATRQAEIHFCHDPNSATCLAWQARQKDKDVKQTQSAIDWLMGEGTGKAIGKGIAGLAIAGLIIWGVTAWRSKS
jgi:hypothetical protein